MKKDELSRGYKTRFNFTKLSIYMKENHITRRKLCKESNISDETLSKVLHGYCIYTSTIDNIINGLDACVPSRKHKLNDICDYE